MEPYKLFVVVDATLSSGLKTAQAVHAAIKFWNEFPTIARPWYTESNNVVVLEDDDLGSLVQNIWHKEDCAISFFQEPDLDDNLTAICVEPKAWRQLSNLRLAS
jgi:hypothetical protein